ncbi:unnamed protein product [Boreogadus saida]
MDKEAQHIDSGERLAFPGRDHGICCCRGQDRGSKSRGWRCQVGMTLAAGCWWVSPGLLPPKALRGRH